MIPQEKSVEIKNVKVIKHRPYCLRHKKPVPGIYAEDYDSYYCPYCDRWLEKACTCGEYPKYPERPSKMAEYL